MKKLLSILTVLAILAFSANVFAAGATTTATYAKVENSSRETTGIIVTILINGDETTGAVTSITFSTASNAGIYSMIKGRKFAKVTAYRTAGGTAPDAADITVKQNLLDLLGGNGVNLIHATSTLSTYPMTDAYPDKIRIYQALVVAVANQATASADITIELLFEN